MRGYSLLEVLLVLAILASVALLSWPLLQTQSNQTRADVYINQLYNTLIMARNVALMQNQVVVICPLVDQQSCKGDWNAPLWVFIDVNHHHQYDATENALRSLTAPVGSRLTWQGFGAQNYLEFLPYGLGNQQNGTFLYCLGSGSNLQTRGIIVSKSGRPRIAMRTAQGGIIDTHGNAVQCQ